MYTVPVLWKYSSRKRSLLNLVCPAQNLHVKKLCYVYLFLLKSVTKIHRDFRSKNCNVLVPRSALRQLVHSTVSLAALGYGVRSSSLFKSSLFWSTRTVTHWPCATSALSRFFARMRRNRDQAIAWNTPQEGPNVDSMYSNHSYSRSWSVSENARFLSHIKFFCYKVTNTRTNKLS
jgi:hypothetical protein